MLGRISLYLLVLSCLFSCSQEAKNKKEQPPNIVFLFADDMTYSAIHALGNEEINTPNLDRMVHEGTTFTHAYNMGGWNGAICAASRAMIISGRDLWRANEFRQEWIEGKSESYQMTWAKLLEQRGYETYMTGKWHVDAPADSIFQNVRHIRPGMPGDPWEHHEMVRQFQEVVGKRKIDGRMVTEDDIMPNGYNRPTGPADDSWSPSDPKHGGFWEGGKHWSEVLKDDALDFIEMTRKSDDPFFMYLAFNAPHDPRQAPQEFIDLYSVDEISLPASWQPEYPDKELMGNGRDLRDEALGPFPRTEYATKVHILEYYAIISHLDAQIGMIVDALEASGKMDNTYIFFSADHGLSVGRHGLLGKQSLYDHSIRPPMMVLGPDIPAGKQVSSDVYLQDIMATSLDLAGIEKPEYVDFHSFLGLAKGSQKEGNYGHIYGAYVDFQRMIRKDDYKLVIYPKSSKKMLFDLTSDPEEMVNLADLPEQADRVREMMSELLQIQKEKEDALDLSDMVD